MEKVLKGLVWYGVLVYIDDIIAFGSTLEGAWERLVQVLVRIRRANLKLKFPGKRLMSHFCLALSYSTFFEIKYV